jgi:hypothetical protein
MPNRSIGKTLTRGLAVVAIAVVAGFATLTLNDSSALARGGGHGGGGHGGGGHGMGGGRAFVGGHGFVGGHAFVGHGGGFRGGRFVRGGRYFWHGRWWWPGIGPCWRWTPWGWVWICGP